MLMSNFHSKYFNFISKRIILLSLFCLSIILSFSQSPSKFYYNPNELSINSIGIRSGFGVIIPHRESMVHLVTGHVISTEIYFEKIGWRHAWNKKYNSPTSGVNLYHAYLSSPNILGNAFAIDYYTNLHLVKKKRFLFDLRLASGLGYLTKTFDPQENNHNVAIGSKMNISIGASFDFKFILSHNWTLATGLSLKHFSNGSFSTPNLGINIPVLMIGLKRNFSKIGSGNFNNLDSTITKLKANHKKFQRYSATIGIGAKEIYPAGGNRYGTYSFELNAIHYATIKSGFSAGMDIIHNVALYKHAFYLDTLTNLKPIQFTQFAMNIGYVQTFDHFELFLQNGFYLINKYKKDGGIYQRLGGRYYFKKNIVAHFALKTHFAKADYFELGFGYYFSNETATEEHLLMKF